MNLHELFETIPLARGDADQQLYSVVSISDFPDCFVGRDNLDTASILFRVKDYDRGQRAPIRLENLEAIFGLPCLIQHNAVTTEGTFTVLRCRATEREVIRYFFSVAETILKLIGAEPTPLAVSTAVRRFATIFQKLTKPSNRAVVGLLGELFVIRQSYDPPRLMSAWRATESSRFDFSQENVRIDAKATIGRVRTHSFSYDQCNPPPGTIALTASLFIEKVSGGPSLRDVIRTVEQAISTNTELLIKLHEIVAETLGAGLHEAMQFRFDEKLAASSLQYFDLKLIPGIRGSLPNGVSDIHFKSDLSACPPVTIASLMALYPESAGFLELLQ